MKKIIAVAVAAMMEFVDNQWLLADFDNHKADCIRHIAETR